jgi:hypothetical protein
MRHAGARERAGTRRGVDATAAAAPCVRGIGFAPEMIAPTAICRAFISLSEETDDRLPAVAGVDRTCRNRHLGRIVMSADIIRFIPRPDTARERTDFPTIAFRSAVKPDELVMDHVDTAPCEHAPAENDASV